MTKTIAAPARHTTYRQRSGRFPRRFARSGLPPLWLVVSGRSFLPPSDRLQLAAQARKKLRVVQRSRLKGQGPKAASVAFSIISAAPIKAKFLVKLIISAIF